MPEAGIPVATKSISSEGWRETSSFLYTLRVAVSERLVLPRNAIRLINFCETRIVPPIPYSKLGNVRLSPVPSSAPSGTKSPALSQRTREGQGTRFLRVVKPRPWAMSTRTGEVCALFLVAAPGDDGYQQGDDHHCPRQHRRITAAIAAFDEFGLNHRVSRGE